MLPALYCVEPIAGPSRFMGSLCCYSVTWNAHLPREKFRLFLVASLSGDDHLPFGARAHQQCLLLDELAGIGVHAQIEEALGRPPRRLHTVVRLLGRRLRLETSRRTIDCRSDQFRVEIETGISTIGTAV